MAQQQSRRPTSYGLLLFPQFEVLDAAGPIEMLNVKTFYLEDPDMKLSVIAQSLDPLNPGPIAPQTTAINFNGQQSYVPTHTYETAPPLDVLIVPGGRGVNRSDEELKPMLDFLRKTYYGSDGRPPLQYMFSVCTGSELLAKAGILDGHRATTNKRAWKRVAPSGPKTHWIARARWVESGNIWTCSGVSAGMDGMIALIAKTEGEKTAQMVCDVVEHTRVKDSGDDPFAEMNGCEDVLPVGEQ